MIKALSGITKAPIDELIAKLEEDFINCIRNPNQKSLLRAAELEEAYNNIYAHYQANGNDVGGKLFILFHESFEEMCRISKKIMSYDKTLNIVTEDWSSITEIQQSRSLFISPVKTNILMTLDQLLMVKRVQTMIEFFGNCLQIAWAFKGSGGAINFDVEFLSRPIKAFITDLLTKCVLGRTTYSLSLLICSLQQPRDKEQCLSLDQLCLNVSTNSTLLYCEKFIITLEEKFRRQETGGFYQKLIHQQTEYIKHVTYIISAHHWLHEEYFLTTNVMPPYPRANILLQAQNFIPSLSNWNASLNKIDIELKQCTMIVLQRLKWAVGANPLINDLMNKFESISHAKAINYERESVLAEKALKFILAIINYEMLRVKTQKAVLSDEELLRFLHQWESVCLAERSVAHTVSPIEEGLIELLHPEGPIDMAWIENVTSLIDDMINQVHSEIDSNEKTMVNAQDSLHLSAHKLRNLMSVHHRIFGDIKNLLKNILKYDECGAGNGNELLREYFAKYKNFLDNVTELHGNVLSKDFTDVMMKQIKEQVERATHISNDIYNELFSFEKTLLSNEERCHSDGNRHSVEYPGSPMKKGMFRCESFKMNKYFNSISIF
jgi:PI-3-kinase-related kinase SMG-1